MGKMIKTGPKWFFWANCSDFLYSVCFIYFICLVSLQHLNTLRLSHGNTKLSESVWLFREKSKSNFATGNKSSFSQSPSQYMEQNLNNIWTCLWVSLNLGNGAWYRFVLYELLVLNCYLCIVCHKECTADPALPIYITITLQNELRVSYCLKCKALLSPFPASS